MDPTESHDAVAIAAGQLDGGMIADLVIDFGPGVGLYTFKNNFTWGPLHPLSAQGLVVADLMATGAPEIVIGFGTAGLWKYSGSTWGEINSSGVSALSDRPLSLNPQVDQLVNALSSVLRGNLSADDLRREFPIGAMSPELHSVLSHVEHDLSDADIRGRDGSYKEIQESTVVRLIAALSGLATWLIACSVHFLHCREANVSMGQELCR